MIALFKGKTMKTEARTDVSGGQKLLLLSLAGEYIRSLRSKTMNTPKVYKRLENECKRYDLDLNYVLKQAIDYFKRCPNSEYK